MKLLLFCTIMACNLTLCAQKLFVGNALVYGDDISSLGVNIRSAYFISKHICMGPEFTLFAPHLLSASGGEEVRTLWEANLNAHYLLPLSHECALYPLLGINLNQETAFVFHNQKVEADRILFPGLVIGGGVHLEVGNLILIIEYDRIIGEIIQNSLSLGFYTGLGKKKSMLKHETH